MAIESFLSEIEKTLEDKKVKTTLFLINKISVIAKNHIEKNPQDGKHVRSFISGIHIKPIDNLREEIKNKTTTLMKAKRDADQKIMEMASHKIRNGSVVFIYGNSGRVISALEKAKTRKTDFSVCTIDSGPLMHGRIAMKKIAGSKIKVRHFPDILARNALASSDIMFFEPNAVRENGRLLSPVGLNNVIETARMQNVQVYGLFNSYNGAAHSGEETKTENITAIINENGILRPSEFFRKVHS